MAIQVVERVELDTMESGTGEPWARGTDYAVSWPALIIGAFSSLCALIAFGLLGSAFSAHQMGADGGPVDWKTVGLGALAFAVFTAFFAYAIGGWVAGKLTAGGRRRAAAHGAMSWVVSVPVMLALLAVGAGTGLGALTAGLAPAQSSADVEQAEAAVRQGVETAANPLQAGETAAPDPAAAAAARNTALTALTLMLLGLAGGWLGGGAAGAQREAALEDSQELT